MRAKVFLNVKSDQMFNDDNNFVFYRLLMGSFYPTVAGIF